jgi:2'-5' RNA ligase
MEQNAKRLRRGGAVTVAVPGVAADCVDAFRRQYDPNVTHIVPHITLAFAPELDVCDWMPARPRMREALTRIHPFTVQVTGVGTFMDDLVLWLRPTAPHGELLTLRQTILRLFPDVAFDRVHDFVPHISIGFFAGRQALLLAMNAVRQELVPFSFRVAHLSFLQADEGNIWQCVDTVELGEEEAGSFSTCAQ